MDTQETSIYQLIIVATIVIGGILIYSFITALRQQSKYSRDYTREIESEINNLENERKRIAADLHDDLGPVLSAAKMKLSGISALTPEDTLLINKSIEYIDNMTCRIRAIASGLMPSVLLDKGPVLAIQQFIDNLALDKNLKVILIASDLPKIKQSASIHLFRIVQEIIHNTIKHSQASILQVNINEQKNSIIIATADNGIGFNFNKAMVDNKGYGLSNIQSRAQLLNGNLSVNSMPKKGTRFYIEMPLGIIRS